MIQDAAVIPPHISSSYPASLIAFISNCPRPPASAIADPDIPEKIREAATFTCPIPPVKCPRIAFAKLNILSVIPDPFINIPVSTKKGTLKG